ncbi:hypothetical protein [Nocardia tengchongensis]|uniref:hypothetical protein n=1 Tax=Nocardia tengchongensis TaxID=2055889 RepID=UPI00365480B3
MTYTITLPNVTRESATAVERAWAPDLTYQPIQAGHFMAEEKPTEIATFITGLAARHA